MPTHRRTTSRRTFLQTTVAAPVALLATHDLWPTASAGPANVDGTGLFLGMAAPAPEWDRALADTGPVRARRLFSPRLSVDSVMNELAWCKANNVHPIVSFKSDTSWKAAARGAIDKPVAAIRDKLAALEQPLSLVVDHEPYGDGYPKAWAKMQKRLVPIMRDAHGITAGPIMNGFPFGAKGWSDAKIGNYLPDDLLPLCDFVAADIYQGGDDPAHAKETCASRLVRFNDWGARHGVEWLGIGEFNAWTAQGITDACQVLKTNLRFRWACLYNSDHGNRDWTLRDERLAAFKAELATA